MWQAHRRSQNFWLSKTFCLLCLSYIMIDPEVPSSQPAQADRGLISENVAIHGLWLY